MDFSNDELERIEQYATVFMTLDEIALLLHKEQKLFRKEALTEGTPANQAYQRGKLSSKFEINQSIVKMAKMGSPQAQKDVVPFINQQMKNERER